jgi:RNA recognition motif-containing protein
MAGTRLFVGNIPYATSEQDLRELFGRSGSTVTSARVVTDLDTGRSRGYGFVELSSAEEAGKAIRELNNFNLNGRTIIVAEARGRGPEGSPRQDRGR